MSKPKYLVFDNTVTPLWPGVYQRCFQDRWVYAFYDGDGWRASQLTPKKAAVEDEVSHYQRGDKSEFSSLQWRGLAKKP